MSQLTTAMQVLGCDGQQMEGTMYCEARTSTGLGCDSLGIEQCYECLKTEIWDIVAKTYQEGQLRPNYPLPVPALTNMRIHRYDYSDNCHFEQWAEYCFNK